MAWYIEWYTHTHKYLYYANILQQTTKKTINNSAMALEIWVKKKNSSFPYFIVYDDKTNRKKIPYNSSVYIVCECVRMRMRVFLCVYERKCKCKCKCECICVCVWRAWEFFYWETVNVRTVWPTDGNQTKTNYQFDRR